MTTQETRNTLKFTKMCKYWKSKRCTMGDACNFAHSSEEIRHAPSLVATQLCFQFSAKGMCSKGEACTFAHSKEEIQPMPLEAIEAPKRPAKAPKEPKNPKKSQPKSKVHSPALDPLSQMQLLQMKICQLAELQQSVPVPSVPFVPFVPFRPPPGLEAPMGYLPHGRVDKFECGSMVSTSLSCTPRLYTMDSDSEPCSPLSRESEAIWF
eukprot:symbB.v1.2.011644.t1/scaffold789.1/size230748/5